MSFFDNAKQIMIDNKEVASIELGNKTIYEKAEEVEENHNLKIRFCGDNYGTEIQSFQSSIGGRTTGLGILYYGITIPHGYLCALAYQGNIDYGGYDSEYNSEQIRQLYISYWYKTQTEVKYSYLDINSGDEYIYVKMVDGEPILTKTPCE